MAIFEDSFEDGTYDAWDDKAGGDQLTIVTTDPHAGAYHANAYCNGSGTGEVAFLYKTISGIPTVYSRAYFKLKTNLPATSQIYILMTHFVGSNNINLVRIYNDAGTIKWNLYYLSTAETWVSIYSTEEVELDTWYCVELKTVINDVSGSATLYINGDIVCNATGLDNNFYSANITMVRMGEIYSTAATTHSTYFDSVIIDSSYIGIEEGGGGDPGIATYWEPQRLSSDPSVSGWDTDEEGALWYNTTTDTFKYWTGSTIRVLTTS